jgi:hypothetical protein
MTTREHVLSVLLVLAVVAMIVVGVVVRSEGKRVGQATANIASLNATIDQALERGAAAERREKVWRDSASRAHDAAQLLKAGIDRQKAKADSLKRLRDDDTCQAPCLTTNDSLAYYQRHSSYLEEENAELRATVDTAEKTIDAQDKELAARDSADRERDAKELEAETRYRALEKINGEMKKLAQSRTSKVVTAGKWILTGFAIGKALR